MAAAQITDEAFVTLATNDSYSLGALTLGHSLKRVGTTRVLVCLITKDVSQSVKEQLSRVFTLVEVNILDSQDAVNLELLTRPDLGVTFTKLHCWRLTQFKKCVFLDADTLVLQNIDDLFEREELSAAADVGWPDCFNSGVFVYKPSEKTYEDLLRFALDHGSFDGGDQGLLNSFFSDWATKDIKHHLPFLYNVVAQSFYTYLPAFKRFGKDAKILHFIGVHKPWLCHYHSDTGAVDCPGDLGLYCQDFLKLWWQIFTENVHFSADSLKKFAHLGEDKSKGDAKQDYSGYSQEQLDDQKRQQSWEEGHIDYMGIDSFQYIQKQLEIKTGKPINGDHHHAETTSSPISIPIPASSVKPPSPVAAPVAEPPKQPQQQESSPKQLQQQSPPEQQHFIVPQHQQQLHASPPQQQHVQQQITQQRGPTVVVRSTKSIQQQHAPHGATGISVKASTAAHHKEPTHPHGVSSVKIVTKSRSNQ